MKANIDLRIFIFIDVATIDAILSNTIVKLLLEAIREGA